MTRYDASGALEALKDFQLATVDHVMDRFYGSDPTRRFLVADETGLGKSLVARGVIARTLERLQDDDSVDRVDVVYVCSNVDIAAQNLARLRVTPGEPIALTTRLTMMATHSARLAEPTHGAGKPVNLVALTPGTSFDRGWRTGSAPERAMLFLLLERLGGWDGWRRRAAVRALQAGVHSPVRFEDTITRLDVELGGVVDERILGDFGRAVAGSGMLAAFEGLLDEIGRRSAVPVGLAGRAREIISALRASLARAGVQTLEPDLIILDEFQRFRHLLSDAEGGESAELARHLFDYGNARVLLLSATPYKPYTLAEEAAAGEDHYRDFRDLLGFLCPDPGWNADVTRALESYRESLVRGLRSGGARQTLRELLLRVMCRTERPAAAQQDMLRERVVGADEVSAEDVRGYVALRGLADAVNARLTVEYWKSAPYFLNFTEGYQLGDLTRAALRTGAVDVAPLLEGAQLLDRTALGSYAEIDLGNSRLRRVAEHTVERGWWTLLWVPPSLPYHELGEPFAELAGMTKQLVFSSWAATPTAVAGLLSYEAERRIVEGRLKRNDPEERRRVATRLDFRVDRGRPAAMSALVLFWPHPELARLCDPLPIARERPDRPLGHPAMLRAAKRALTAAAPADLRTRRHAGEVQPWQAVFRWPGALPGGLTEYAVENALTGGRADDTGESGLRRHVAEAFSVAAAEQYPVARRPADVAEDLAMLGLHGPGNVAWRALDRLRPGTPVTDAGHWTAAATLSAGLRSLFNRVEAELLLDRLDLDPIYWRSVLRYAAAGDLQAVLDEYLHHLRGPTSDHDLDDTALHELARLAASALSLRSPTYRAFDPADGDSVPLLSRFAMRYGGRRNEVDDVRAPEVRNAFNSPFWPFVLTTTSVGQEGIDFHWWCSTVVHWNTPANPVDFEQREGRVHRFGGHAVRRNVAARHRVAALTADTEVWAAAYDAARRDSGDLGDFAPYWVYPGPAKIERVVLPYPVSRDTGRYERLCRDLALYRLAFGQPRQEDMLDLLRRAGTTAEQADDLALSLRPPARGDSLRCGGDRSSSG